MWIIGWGPMYKSTGSCMDLRSRQFIGGSSGAET